MKYSLEMLAEVSLTLAFVVLPTYEAAVRPMNAFLKPSSDVILENHLLAQQILSALPQLEAPPKSSSSFSAFGCAFSAAMHMVQQQCWSLPQAPSHCHQLLLQPRHVVAPAWQMSAVTLQQAEPMLLQLDAATLQQAESLLFQLDAYQAAASFCEYEATP